MSNQRQVYLLDARHLSPETIAVSFAKTSRSPDSFRDIASELSDSQSSEFHEKWVVGYGHASVAEHAVLHIAIENVSRMAVEAIQANRLASFTEKSTRYQKWGSDQFVLPVELHDHRLQKTYQDTCSLLFSTYQTCMEKLMEYLVQVEPLQKNEPEKNRHRRIRSTCTDACRFLLPACSMANVGITINARSLEYAIIKMLSHPLDEVRAIGREMKNVALQSVPTLVKYAEPNNYLSDLEAFLVNNNEFHALQSNETQKIKKTDDWLRTCSLDNSILLEEQMLAAIMFRFTCNDYAECVNIVHHLDDTQRQHLIHRIADRTDRFRTPIRELEYSSFSFEALIDQGAYYELKRHRMMTQTPKPLTACQGYAIPRQISEAGLEDIYRNAMTRVEETFFEIVRVNPNVASYIIPNAFNRQIFFSLNLRNAIHLITLRTAPNAHFSIRRFAQRLGDEIKKLVPSFAPYLTPYNQENWQTIEEDYFSQVF